MVGHLGVGPRSYRFIRAAPSPVGERPAGGGGVDPPGVTLCGLSRPAAAPAAHLPWKRAAVPTRSVHTPSRFRGGACDPGRFTLCGAGDGEFESQGFHPPPAFQAGTTTW